MINVSRLIGQPVISLGDAERRGAVRGVRFEGNRIVSLDADGTTIPMDAVRTLEGDAITFEMAGEPTTEPSAESDHHQAEIAAAAPLSPSDGPGESGSRSIATQTDTPPGEPTSDVESAQPWSGNPIGKLLLTTAGDALGAIAEVNVESDGTVREIVDDGGRSHDGSRLIAVGSFAAIIADQSELGD